MVSCVLLPFLSGFPAIFHVFFAVLTSFPQMGHFAMIIPLRYRYHMIQHKTFAVNQKFYIQIASLRLDEKSSATLKPKTALKYPL